jgi:hypothetical protein
VVSNHGTVASPGGATLTVSCDSRVFSFTGMSGSFGASTPEALTIVSNTTENNRSTITGLIPYPIPAGTDSFTGFRVALDFDTVAVYPNDAVQPVLDSTWLIGSPAGDSDTTNDTASYPGYTDVGPATACGVLADATWQRVEFAGGTGYSHRATSATLYKTTVDLAEGDVVSFSLSYTDGDPATIPDNLSGSQINFNGVVLNDVNRRAQNISSATNTDRTGFDATP